MTTYNLGFTRPGLGRVRLAPDTMILPGRITGPAGLCRTYGQFVRRVPVAAPTGGGTGAGYIFESPVVM